MKKVFTQILHVKVGSGKKIFVFVINKRKKMSELKITS